MNDSWAQLLSKCLWCGFLKIIIILYYLPLQTKELNRQLKNVPVVNKKDIIDQIMLNKKIILALNFLQPYV